MSPKKSMAAGGNADCANAEQRENGIRKITVCFFSCYNGIQEKQMGAAKMKINQYSEYINDVFSCIKCLFPTDRNPEVAFSEGSLPSIYSGSNGDIAILRNEDAELFVNIMRRHCEMFGISKETAVLQRSKIYKNEVKYQHRCYPKNLHRWLNGTISRKRLCRVEFVVMVYCWAVRWERSGEADTDSPDVRELFSICKRYDEGLSDHDSLIKCLWSACEKAYIITL